MGRHRPMTVHAVFRASTDVRRRTASRPPLSSSQDNVLSCIESLKLFPASAVIYLRHAPRIWPFHGLTRAA
jgi:hypothetical protein